MAGWKRTRSFIYQPRLDSVTEPDWARLYLNRISAKAIGVAECWQLNVTYALGKVQAPSVTRVINRMNRDERKYR